MEFTIKQIIAGVETADCVILPVINGQLTPAAEPIDTACSGLLSRLIQEGDLAEKAGATLWIPLPDTVAPRKALLVQLGKEPKSKSLRDSLHKMAHALLDSNHTDAILYLDLGLKKQDATWLAHETAVACLFTGYRFDRFKTKPESACRLQQFVLGFPQKSDINKAKAGLTRGLALGHGLETTRDLANLPANVCNPSYLAAVAGNMAGELKIKCNIVEQSEMQALGMEAFLAVAKGSAEAPKLIVLEYKGAKGKPVVLVGKGITFDSGGISLKPGEGMDEMKFDMCGAASVLGTLRAIAEQQLPIHVVGLIPTCENMPSGMATRPGDIVSSMSGQTIEILNTDAEGRLILCDTLTYAARFEPEVVIDIATLTGACVIALGHVASGLIANEDDLADALLDAANKTGDLAWRLPLFEEYQEQLKSNFADMANIGGRPGGAITAAAFLSRFTENYAWAHLDIAGTAWKSGKDKGATGRPVALLEAFLYKRATAHKSK